MFEPIIQSLIRVNRVMKGQRCMLNIWKGSREQEIIGMIPSMYNLISPGVDIAYYMQPIYGDVNLTKLNTSSSTL